MKAVILIAILSSALWAVSPASAQPAGAADKGTKPQQQAPNVTDFDRQAALIQENIKTMQEQMEKIRQTQDPQERQKLLQEHWATMQGGMGMMQGMWGPGMMGCCGGGPAYGGWHMGGPGMMGWRGMGGYYSKLTPEQLKQRQYMMDQYLGMQQQMMNQMMYQQNYMWGR
ncbi:MAG: hypothetical protein Q7K57_44075 [Burkholderiaceae bacterium]|nr:hypothetical protein [Burkholderiaceae bacterium]